jgi:hypothetical protein
VAVNSLGDFVVSWASDGQDGDLSGVFAQRFDRNATALGTEFQVNTTTTGFQSLDSVASDATGNFVITWITLHRPLVSAAAAHGLSRRDRAQIVPAHAGGHRQQPP